MLGVLPDWVVAVAASCMASLFNVMGFVIQKVAVQRPGGWPRVGDMVLSPLWASGLLLNFVAVLPAAAALSLAPLTLVGPLFSVTVVLNTLAAPLALGERPQPWPDFAASGLIVVGTVLSSLMGPHSDGPAVGRDRLLELLADRVFLLVLSALLLFAGSCFLLMRWHGESILAEAARRPANPPLKHVVLPAGCAASAGAVASVVMKATGELVKSRHSSPLVLLVCALCLAPFAGLQMNYVNRGLRLYYQTIYFPTYTALLVLLSTVLGTLFFQEYAQFVADGRRLAGFALGVALGVLGVGLFTFRIPEPTAPGTSVAKPGLHGRLLDSEGGGRLTR